MWWSSSGNPQTFFERYFPCWWYKRICSLQSDGKRRHHHVCSFPWSWSWRVVHDITHFKSYVLRVFASFWSCPNYIFRNIRCLIMSQKTPALSFLFNAFCIYESPLSHWTLILYVYFLLEKVNHYDYVSHQYCHFVWKSWYLWGLLPFQRFCCYCTPPD